MIHCSEVAVPAVAGAGLDAAGIDVLLGFASGEVSLHVDGALGGQVLALESLPSGRQLPTTTSLASGSCCSLAATSSSIALQVLSTRHGFLTLGYSHSLSLLACGGGGGGGGGLFTVTVAEDDAFKPRESVQVALIVIGPGEAPVVVRVAELPLPEMLPLLALQPATVTGTLSGLVQVQVMVAVPPASTLDGLAEQET